jgi:1-deoxy-D-xylulose-5-phosphate reductoisomerase
VTRSHQDCQEAKYDLVVNALVGFAGFPPTIAALKKKATICLANKESLVVGGEIVNRLLKKGYGRFIRLIPNTSPWPNA